MKLYEVLHKPTPPPNVPTWHIVLQGHPEELLDVLELICFNEHDVVRTAEWTGEHELTICLTWIDDVIPKFARADIHKISDYIVIKENGRTTCHGHNQAK